MQENNTNTPIPNMNQPMEQPNPKGKKKLPLFLALAGILLIAILLSTYAIYSRYQKYETPNIPQEQPETNTQPGITNNPNANKQMVLRRNLKVVYAKDITMFSLNVILWGNDLIYVADDNSIVKYSFEGDNTEELLPASESYYYDEPNGENRQYYIGQLAKVDDILFVSYIEEYGNFESKIISLNLINNERRQISGGLYSQIKQFGNDIFLTGGFGDGCGGKSFYRKLNPADTLEEGPFLNLIMGCEEGDSLLAADPQRRFFLIYTYANLDPNLSSDSQTYTKISKVSFDNLLNKHPLVDQSDILNDIMATDYDEPTGDLYLTDSKHILYRMNVDSEILEEIGVMEITLDEDHNYYLSGVLDGNLCINKYSKKGYGEGVYSLYSTSNASLLEQESTSCKKTFMKTEEDRAIKYLDELNLPSEYKYQIEIEDEF